MKHFVEQLLPKKNPVFLKEYNAVFRTQSDTVQIAVFGERLVS